MAQKNAELTATLKDTQHRTDAMTAAAEELYAKHITVCRYDHPLSEVKRAPLTRLTVTRARWNPDWLLWKLH